MRAILVSFLLHIKVDMIDCVIVLVNRGVINILLVARSQRKDLTSLSGVSDLTTQLMSYACSLSD